MDRDFIDLKQFQLKGNLSPRTIGLAVVAFLILVLVFTSWYTVSAESVGVVLRLGKYSHTTQPGPHLKIPFGIDQVTLVQIRRQFKAEFGFRTEQPGIRTRYSDRDFEIESLMLTGDLNVADVEWTVQYRIADPFNYLFQVRNVEETFFDMSQAVMREIVGDRTVNEVLTVGRTELAVSAQAKLQELADQYQTGIRVDQVILQDITPPDPVKPSFNAVNQAQQEKEKVINEARAEYNLAVPAARGEADQMIRQAEGYSIERVNRARGEAARFTSVLEEYRKAPAVTRRRIYIETLSELLPKIGRKLVIDKDLQNVVNLLQLGKEGTNNEDR